MSEQGFNSADQGTTRDATADGGSGHAPAALAGSEASGAGDAIRARPSARYAPGHNPRFDQQADTPSSTRSRYGDGMGAKLAVVAEFPNRLPALGRWDKAQNTVL